MQLAMSLTSYKNTIHIFKLTYIRLSFLFFLFCFKKAANSECSGSDEMQMQYPPYLDASPFPEW